MIEVKPFAYKGIYMQKDVVEAVLNHPKYHELVRRRTRLSMTFFWIALVLYTSFILTLAYVPKLFATPLASGMVLNWGLLCGFLIIIVAVLMIMLYVRLSNKHFDPMLEEILRDVE